MIGTAAGSALGGALAIVTGVAAMSVFAVPVYSFTGAIAVTASTIAKDVFTRARPAQTDDPNKWFQGKGHYSFPSGEVTFVSAAVASSEKKRMRPAA